MGQSLDHRFVLYLLYLFCVFVVVFVRLRGSSGKLMYTLFRVNTGIDHISLVVPLGRL